MTLKFLDIYNEVAGQAWSMFDPDAESAEDFESALKTSINKALSYLWNSYPFTFKEKTRKSNTKVDGETYTLPNGNIVKKTINGQEVYAVKVNGSYLAHKDTSLEDEEKGIPESFYISGDKIHLYPIPDDSYPMVVEYHTLEVGISEDGDRLYELKNDNDYIDIPEKYEIIFKNALITLSMVYAIADQTDENYAGYKSQFDEAYNVLLQFQKGIDINKRIVI